MVTLPWESAQELVAQCIAAYPTTHRLVEHFRAVGTSRPVDLVMAARAPISRGGPLFEIVSAAMIELEPVRAGPRSPKILLVAYLDNGKACERLVQALLGRLAESVVAQLVAIVG